MKLTLSRWRTAPFPWFLPHYLTWYTCSHFYLVFARRNCSLPLVVAHCFPWYMYFYLVFLHYFSLVVAHYFPWYMYFYLVVLCYFTQLLPIIFLGIYVFLPGIRPLELPSSPGNPSFTPDISSGPVSSCRGCPVLRLPSFSVPSETPKQKISWLHHLMSSNQNTTITWGLFVII